LPKEIQEWASRTWNCLWLEIKKTKPENYKVAEKLGTFVPLKHFKIFANGLKKLVVV